MLPKHYRFLCKNATGVTLSFGSDAALGITLLPWKYVDGALAYHTTELTDDFGFDGTDTIANDANSGATQNFSNATNLFLGAEGTFRVKADLATADGPVYLYMETSTDGTVWPSNDSTAAVFDIEKHCTLVAVAQITSTAIDQEVHVNFGI